MGLNLGGVSSPFSSGPSRTPVLGGPPPSRAPSRSTIWRAPTTPLEEEEQPPARGFPEKADANKFFRDVMYPQEEPGIAEQGADIAATLGLVPGRALEMPFSVLNSLSKVATGTPQDKPGFLDDAIAAIGKTPIGDLLGGLNDLLIESGKVGPAIVNSGDLSRLILLQGQPDSALLREVDPTMFRSTNLISLFGNVLDLGATVGDFRKEMGKRGFGPNDVSDIVSGRQATTDYGNHPSNSNPLIGLGQSLALDPTNALFILGPVRALTAVRSVAEGIGLAEKFRVAGLIGKTMPGVAASASGIRSGQVAAVTTKGIGRFLKEELATSGPLTRRYAAASTALSLGVVATDAVTGALAPRGPNGDMVPGFLKDLHDLSSSILNDHPLSDGAAYNFFAAFHYPIRDMAGKSRKALRTAAFGVKGGEGTLAEFAILHGEGKNLAAKKDDFYRRVGGEEGYLQLIAHMADKITMKRIGPTIRHALAGIDDAASRETTMHEMVHVERDRLFLEGKITNKEIISTWKEWWGEQGGMLKTGARQVWDPNMALSHWVDSWVPAQAKYGALAWERGTAVIGLATKLTKEHIIDMKSVFKSAAKGNGGIVPLSLIAELRQKYPQLVDSNPKFAKYAMRDAIAPAWTTLRDELTAAQRKAPSSEDVTRELGTLERQAPPDPAPLPPDVSGPLTATGFNPDAAGHRYISPEFSEHVLGTAKPPVTPTTSRIAPEHLQRWEAGRPGVSAVYAPLIEALADAKGLDPNDIAKNIDVISSNDIPTGSKPQAPRIALAEQAAENLLPMPAVERASARLSRSLVEGRLDSSAPPREATVLPNGMIIGAKSPAQWLTEINRVFEGDESLLRSARNWYSDLMAHFVEAYGPSEAPKMALAWLLSQKRASPSAGFKNVLRAFDQVSAAPRPVEKKAGLSAKAIKAVLRGEDPHLPEADKLHDFVDSFIGKLTRTLLRNDKRGGQPAAFDVWAVRDRGYVDETMATWAKDKLGIDLKPDMKSSPAGSEAHYEEGVRFYNRVAEHMNEVGFDGGGWTAAEAQAVGWTRVKIDMGDPVEFASDIVGKNTYRVSSGIAPGRGTPLESIAPAFARLSSHASVKVAKAYSAWIAPRLESLTGVKHAGTESGLGFLRDAEPGPRSVMSLIGSPEQIADAADILGHVGQQEAILASRPLKSGRTPGIDIIPDGPHFDDHEVLTSFVRQIQKDLPTIQVQPLMVNGVPAIRILKGDAAWVVAKVDKAVQRAAESLPFDVTSRSGRFDVVTSKNDWSVNKHGSSYQQALRKRGRSGIADALVGLQDEAARKLSDLIDEHGSAAGATASEHFQGTPGTPLVRGYTVRQGVKAITAFTDAADASTAIHEAMHGFVWPLMDAAERSTLLRHLKDEERVAKAFERYVSEGKAPIKALEPLFTKMKGLIQALYENVRRSPLRGRFDPEVRAVFDDMFTPIEQRIQKAYDRGDVARGQQLNKQASIFRGGTTESGGAMRATIRVPEDIVLRTTENGGGTFDVASGKALDLKSGYGVGEGGRGLVVKNTPEAVRAAYLQVAKDTGSAQVGTWLNPADGLVYVDPSTVVMDLERALDLARQRGEKAIYDHATGEDIIVHPKSPSDAIPPTVDDLAPMRASQDAAAGATPETVELYRQLDKDALNVLDDPPKGVSYSGRPMSSQAAEDLRKLNKALQDEWPGYEVKFPPRIATVLRESDISNPQIKLQLTRLNSLYEMARYASPLTPLGNAFSLLFDANPGTGMRARARQSIYNYALPRGALTSEINKIINELKDDAEKNAHHFRNLRLTPHWESLKPRNIEMVAQKHLSKKAYEKIVQDFGGFTKLVDRSGNRVVQAAHMADGVVTGRLGRALEGVYGGVQKSVPGGAMRFIKTYYPIFRFAASARYWAMNVLEANILGMAKYGSAYKEEAISGFVHRTNSVPKDRAVMEASAVASLDFGGATVSGRKFAGMMQASFDPMRMESAQNILDNLPRSGHEFQSLVTRFGPEEGTWSKQLDDMLYQFDSKGVRKALDSEARKIIAEPDMVMYGPMLQRLYEINDGNYQAIVKMYEGNQSRSNMERILNSYFLYWPLTYQIKASKWLFDVLTERSFGRKTNFAGAYTYTRLLETHKERLVNDDDYAKMFENNEDIWFAAQMFLPITPGDLGVSLNRGVRYAGGALGWWGAYKESSDPIAAIGALANLGPNYDIQILRRVSKQATDDETPAPPKRKKATSTAAKYAASARSRTSDFGRIVQP